MSQHGADMVLVQRYLEGVPQAGQELARLCHASAAPVVGHRRWGLPDAAAREELLADIVAAALEPRTLGGYRGEASLATFFGRIARYRCIDDLRRKRLHKQVSLDELPEAPSAAESPDQAREREEAVERVREALLELPEGERDVLLWKYHELQSRAQIAERLRLSVFAVDKRLRKALDRLRASRPLQALLGRAPATEGRLGRPDRLEELEGQR